MIKYVYRPYAWVEYKGKTKKIKTSKFYSSMLGAGNAGKKMLADIRKAGAEAEDGYYVVKYVCSNGKATRQTEYQYDAGGHNLTKESFDYRRAKDSYYDEKAKKNARNTYDMRQIEADLEDFGYADYRKDWRRMSDRQKIQAWEKMQMYHERMW